MDTAPNLYSTAQKLMGRLSNLPAFEFYRLIYSKFIDYVVDYLEPYLNETRHKGKLHLGKFGNHT